MDLTTVLEDNGLTAHYITQPSSWRVFAGSHEVGDVAKEDWANDNIDFASKEAGMMLLEQFNILRTAFDEKEGIVTEIEDPSRAVESGSLPNADQGTDKEIADEVLRLMSDVLDEAETFGHTKAHLAAIEELEAIYKKAISKK